MRRAEAPGTGMCWVTKNFKGLLGGRASVVTKGRWSLQFLEETSPDPSCTSACGFGLLARAKLELWAV